MRLPGASMSARARVNVPSPHPRSAQIVGPSASTLSASMSIASRNRIESLPTKYAPMTAADRRPVTAQPGAVQATFEGVRAWLSSTPRRQRPTTVAAWADDAAYFKQQPGSSLKPLGSDGVGPLDGSHPSTKKLRSVLL